MVIMGKEIIRDLKILHQVSEPAWSGIENKKTIEELINTLKIHNKKNKEKGVGLASIQINIPVQIFITYFFNEPKIYLNPIILKVSENKFISTEKCLSIPGMTKNIQRHCYLEIYNNYKGRVEKLGEEFPDQNNPGHRNLLWQAAVFQHEFSHLFGILINDEKQLDFKNLIRSIDDVKNTLY